MLRGYSSVGVGLASVRRDPSKVILRKIALNHVSRYPRYKGTDGGIRSCHCEGLRYVRFVSHPILLVLYVQRFHYHGPRYGYRAFSRHLGFTSTCSHVARRITSHMLCRALGRSTQLTYRSLSERKVHIDPSAYAHETNELKLRGPVSIGADKCITVSSLTCEGKRQCVYTVISRCAEGPLTLFKAHCKGRVIR